MKISSVEAFQCDAGWRPWTFVKIVSDSGIVGWSECSDSFGSHAGLAAVIKDLGTRVIGRDPFAIEKIYWELYAGTRQSAGGVIQKAIAGIENALLDLKGKALRVPVYELLGGKIRDVIPLYWSHFVTTRVRSAALATVSPIRTLDDIRAIAAEAKQRGFRAVKTNIILFDGAPRVHMPGFGRSDGGPELNCDPALLRGTTEYIAALRSALGDETGIMLDLNFNFKTEGYKAFARALEPYRLTWLELDSYDSRSLREIKDASRMPICSGENLYGTRDFRAYFEAHAMDIVSVDPMWNGLLQSKKIADMAELYEMNVAPHNHYSHLALLMAAHLSSAMPNFRILEVDVDDVPWKDELVTVRPIIENGALKIPALPGWGADVNEAVLRAHPWPK